MKKLNYTCDIDPINYEEVTRNSSRHLRYSDYKELKDVKFVDDRLSFNDYLGIIGLCIAVLSIIVILFLGV